MGAYAIRPYRNIQYAISHNSFSDQKNSRSIFYDQKLILGIDLFVRQGRGVLNTPHMYLDL